MPGMTGELLADFSDFQRAAQEATVALRGMETGGAKVETSLNAVADSLSGRTLIQNATLMAEAVERIGGVSVLTEKELARVAAQAQEAAEKLRAVGQDVPEGLQNIANQAKATTSSFDGMKATVLSLAGAFGIGFSIDAVVQFGKALIDDAGALVELSAKTGVSIEQLQRMGAAGVGAGVSIESLAQASYKLGIAIEGGDKSVVAALEQLGLSWQDVAAMGEDEAMSTVVRKLEGVESQTLKNKLGNDLYAGAWAGIAPAIVQGYSDIADSAEVSTKAQIQAIDRATAKWNEWVAARKRDLTSMAGEVVIAAEEFGKLGLKEQFVLGVQSLFTANTGGLTVAIGALNGVAQVRATQLDEEKPKQEKAVGLTKEQTETADKYAAAWTELNSVGGTYQNTLDGINTKTIASVKYYLEAGASQGTLATAYGLTDVQVKAIATSMADAEKATKSWSDAENKAHDARMKQLTEARSAENKHGVDLMKDAEIGFGQMKKVKDEYYDSVMQSSMDATTYQVTKIWEAADAQILAFKGGAEERAQYADLVYSLAEQEARGITDVMASAVDQMTSTAIEGVNKVKDEASAAVSQMYSMGGGHKMTAAEYDAYYKTPQGIADIIRNNGKRYYEGEVLPRDSGGAVNAGQPYLIGTGAQPELFVPSTSGTMFPRGGGGGPIHTVINITQPLGTPMAIAAAIEDAMNRTLRNAGVRLPSGA